MGLIALSRNIELVYSPMDADEFGKGYYLQRYPGGETSPLYRTQRDAQKAFERGEQHIKWDH